MAPVPFILGLPVTIWMGAVTLILLFITVLIGLSIRKGWARLPLKYHLYAAGATVVSAIIHASLVFYLYFL
jgi:hypothetical protein